LVFAKKKKMRGRKTGSRGGSMEHAQDFPTEGNGGGKKGVPGAL